MNSVIHSRAMQRADSNTEDMPALRRTFWRRIIAWWARW
jgi:hypothetical protein